MNHRNPPPLGRWILEHLTLGADSDALTGDLLEEYRSGRSRVWYWRQVLFAIGSGFMREVRRRRSILGFALIWILPAPALMICYYQLLRHSIEYRRIWSLPWPWSMLCDIAITLGPSLVFLWFGMAVYLVLLWRIGRTQNMPRFGRGLLGSLITYVLVLLAFLSIPYREANPDIRTIASIYADPWFLLSCMPGFLALSVSIWLALPRPERTSAPVAE